MTVETIRSETNGATTPLRRCHSHSEWSQTAAAKCLLRVQAAKKKKLLQLQGYAAVSSAGAATGPQTGPQNEAGLKRSAAALAKWEISEKIRRNFKVDSNNESKKSKSWNILIFVPVVSSRPTGSDALQLSCHSADASCVEAAEIQTRVRWRQQNAEVAVGIAGELFAENLRHASRSRRPWDLPVVVFFSPPRKCARRVFVRPESLVAGASLAGIMANLSKTRLSTTCSTSCWVC